MASQAFCRSCGAAQPQEFTSQVTRTSEELLEHRISLLQQERPATAFLANENDPFYDATFPYMYTGTIFDGYGTLDEFAEENELESDEIQCDNCKAPFYTTNNFCLDDGNHVFGWFCPRCFVNVLINREIYALEIKADEYKDWKKLSPKPNAISRIRYHYRLVDFVDGSIQNEVECWGCAYTGTKVNLAKPHWEVTFNPHDKPSNIKPVCEACVGQTVIIPDEELSAAFR